MPEAISATQPVSRELQQRAVPPLGLIGSVVSFGIPGAGLSVSIRWLVPWMVRRGFGGLTILNVAFGILAALMLVAALVAFRLEGRHSTWTAFRDRMRLSRPTRKDWLWTLAALSFAFGVTVLIAPIAEANLGLPLVSIPTETKAFIKSMSAGFPEIELSGRWDVLLWFVFWLAVVNIGGEELWWRGIVLPVRRLYSDAGPGPSTACCGTCLSSADTKRLAHGHLFPEHAFHCIPCSAHQEHMAGNRGAPDLQHVGHDSGVQKSHRLAGR